MIYVLILILSYSILPTFLCKSGIFGTTLKMDETQNNIALTFDDGPDKAYTEDLLDVLKLNNVKATFFIVAKHAKENPEIVDRIIKDGHALGLHSLEHKNILARGYRYIKKDFRESFTIVENHNWPITCYRPPWGQVNLFTLYYLRKYGLKIIMWDVMVGDWSKHISTEDIKGMLLQKTENGSIICLHDARGDEGAPKRTIEALKDVIPKLKREYNFVGVDGVKDSIPLRGGMYEAG